MKLGTYIVGQGDNIETLARVLVGDVAQTDSLIRLNSLRYPYISDDPLDQFAKFRGSALLLGPYSDPGTAQTIVSNFVNKVKGDTITNPNIFKHNNGNSTTGLLAPSSSVWAETSGGYALAAVLDGSSAGITNTNNGAQAQQLYSFDLIAIVERRYGFTIPGADVAAKVAWLKSNLTKLTANWYGYGSGPSGNRATVAIRNNNSTGNWVTSAVNTASSPTMTIAAISTALSGWFGPGGAMCDNNGFAHFLAYADATGLAANPTTAPTLSASGSGGALSAGTYFVRYDWENAAGKTLPSAESSITITAGQSIVATVPTDPFGITSTGVYIAKQELQNFVGKLSGNVETLTNNFVGKIGASTVENPNVSRYNISNSALLVAGSGSEQSTAGYTQLATLDGTVQNRATAATSGLIAQQSFSFDLISIVERKYGVPIPGATTADKVTWLKANVKTLTANWYGYGSGPAGNKATMSFWRNDNSTWYASVNHSLGTVTKLTKALSLAADINVATDANGFVHIIAYADASDGTTTSIINTDYFELLVDVVQLVVSNPNSYKSAHSTSLIAPSGGYSEYAQAGIDKIKTLDGTVNSNSIAVSGEIRHDLFSFDLIAITEKRLGSAIPGADVAAKVTWLKANVANLTANWYGYGSGPAGNKAYTAVWQVSGSAWVGSPANHTQSTVTKLTNTITSVSMSNYIDASGFMHVLAYADASDGVTASVINTDYIELQITYTDNNCKLQGTTTSTTYTQSSALVAGAYTATTNTATISSAVNVDYVELQVELLSSSILLNNVNSINIVSGDLIVLIEGSNFGSSVVSSVGSSISLATPISGVFDSGALVRIYSSQESVSTRVLMTGDALIYPISPDAVASAGTSYSFLLGTDLKLDNVGFLVRSASGDIDTVSGLANFAQALMMRFRTVFGALNMHENYGNELFNDLGEATNPYFTGLAKHHIQQCAMQDSRTQSAEVTSFTIDGDKMLIDISIIPIGAQDPVSLSFNIPTGGIG
jgi:hypothetical protein